LYFSNALKRILNYIPLHLSVFLVIGICIQYFLQVWVFGKVPLIVTITLCSILLLIPKRVFQTLLSYIVFTLLGIASIYFSNPKNHANFYENKLKENSVVVLQIDKVLKPGNYYNKYEAKVIQADSLKTTGKVLLNISKDSIQDFLKVDEKLVIQTSFKELIPPLNPHQFDYKSYLAKRGIYEQVFLNKKEYKTLEFNIETVYGLSDNFRRKVQNALRKYNFSNDEFGVINALLLGQRQEISKELINDYSKAGAIHILAVSGLHVGIILLILTSVFKPIERLPKGKIIKTVLIILLLWIFAFIAGLSASVVRAVTMFTFVAIGLSMRKKRVVAYSLISSLLFLLIFKPMFLFDVGFQLSYLAVFGIIWVQPKFYNIWQPKNYIIDKLWQLFTVSVAAQVGILPLSLYYFHQFPGLFVLSNLIIIPFLGIILFGGIVVMLLAYFQVLPEIVASIYEGIIWMMNSIIGWIAHQETFLLKNIS